jgi:hypothetical protein
LRCPASRPQSTQLPGFTVEPAIFHCLSGHQPYFGQQPPGNLSCCCLPHRVALRPGHGLMMLFGCYVFLRLIRVDVAPFGGRYIDTVIAVGREHAWQADQVYSRLGYQCRQLVNEIQRPKDDVRIAIAAGRFELSRSCASMHPQHS